MARVTGYAESLSRVTKTTTGFTDVVALTHTPNDNTTVVYFWSGTAEVASGSSDVQIRFNRDTDAVVDGEYNFEAKEPSTPTDQFTIDGIVIVSYGASPGSKTVSIEYAGEAAGPVAGVTNARILALELGANDAYAVGTSTPDSGTSTTYANVTSAEASLTPASTGDYLIVGSIEHNGNTASAAHRMTIDGVDKQEANHLPRDSTNYLAGTWLGKINLASGSARTAKWMYRSTNGAVTVNVRRGRVLMLRMDDFANSFSGEDRVIGSGTDDTYVTETSLNPTIAVSADHIVLASWVKISGSTTISSYSRLTDGSTVFTENINEATNATYAYAEALVAYRAALTAGSGTTWSIQRKSETTGTTTYIDEACIAILQTGDAAATVVGSGGMDHIDRGIGDIGQGRVPQTMHTIDQGIVCELEEAA